MNFFTYLDIKFQQCAMNKKANFSVKAEQETKAVYMILQAYRWFHKWMAVPRVLWDYILVSVGFREAPVSPLEAMKQAADDGLKAVVKTQAEAPNLSVVANETSTAIS